MSLNVSPDMVQISHHVKITGLAEAACVDELPVTCPPWSALEEFTSSTKLLSPSEATLAHSLLGSAVHIACFSRPDVAHVVSRIAAFNAQHTGGMLTALRHLIRYLNGSSSLALTFCRNSDKPALVFCSDATWATETDPRSVTSYIVLAYDTPVL